MKREWRLIVIFLENVQLSGAILSRIIQPGIGCCGEGRRGGRGRIAENDNQRGIDKKLKGHTSLKINMP